MKIFKPLYATLLLVAALIATSCEKPAPLPQEQTIAVTYSAIDGCWQLALWQGAP